MNAHGRHGHRSIWRVKALERNLFEDTDKRGKIDNIKNVAQTSEAVDGLSSSVVGATAKPRQGSNLETPAQVNLAELMVRYQQGELAAFEALYERLAPKLRGYLSSLTWSRAQSEDLAQDTFLQIHRARHTYLPPRPVTPWAFAIARHVYLMHLRSNARRSQIELSPLEELGDIPVPPVMEGYATRLELLKAIQKLSAERREAVLLHHVWGLSFAEIGAMLGVREGAAKLRAHRALQALRELLKEPTSGDDY